MVVKADWGALAERLVVAVERIAADRNTPAGVDELRLDLAAQTEADYRALKQAHFMLANVMMTLGTELVEICDNGNLDQFNKAVKFREISQKIIVFADRHLRASHGTETQTRQRQALQEHDEKGNESSVGSVDREKEIREKEIRATQRSGPKAQGPVPKEAVTDCPYCSGSDYVGHEPSCRVNYGGGS